MNVGNDIIDLTNSENRCRHKNRRYVNRVLSPQEKESLQRSESPSTYFCQLWSAKEVTYKILKKIDPSLIFSHAKFLVNPFCRNKGQVNYAGQAINVRWYYAKEWIHCIGILNPEKKDLNCVSKVDIINNIPLCSFTARESLSIHSNESKAVRSLCKRSFTDLPLKAIEIIRGPLKKKFGPPQMWIDGKKSINTDLSLSHDGKYMAFTLLYNLN